MIAWPRPASSQGSARMRSSLARVEPAQRGEEVGGGRRRRGVGGQHLDGGVARSGPGRAERQEPHAARGRRGGAGGTVENAQWRAGRIVLQELPRRERTLRRAGHLQRMPQRVLELLARDAAGAQDQRRLHGQGEDRGLDAHTAGPAVEHEVHRAAEELRDVGGRGGAHVAEGVRARRGHRGAGRRDERVGRGVRRDPDADGVEAGGHEVGHLRAAGDDQRERAGPEARGEGAHARVVGRRDPSQVSSAREVHDERVERRAGLHLEDAGHRPRVEGVGAEAVDGLGGEGHEPAPAQDDGRLRDRERVGGRKDAWAHDAGATGGSWAAPPRAREASMPQAASMSGPPE